MTTPITFHTLTIDGGVILGGKPVSTLRAAEGYTMTWDPGTPWVRVQAPAGPYLPPTRAQVLPPPLLIPVARCHGEEEPSRALFAALCTACTESELCAEHDRETKACDAPAAPPWPNLDAMAKALVTKPPRAIYAPPNTVSMTLTPPGGDPVTIPLPREPESPGVPAKARGRKGRRPTG